MRDQDPRLVGSQVLEAAVAEDKFNQKKAKYFSRIALANKPAMHILKESGVLGGVKGNITEARSAGWRNVGEHNGAGLIVMDEILDLSGVPEIERPSLRFAAGTHDADKRISREGNKLAEQRTAVGTVIEYDVVKEALAEARKTGIARVTGSDLRDFRTWTLGEMALRYTDSVLIPVPGGPHTDIVPWRERIDELRQRHPKANIEEGKIYTAEVLEEMGLSLRPAEGEKTVPFYDVLEEVMEIIEPELYKRAMETRPHLKQTYPSSDMYFNLMQDRINQKIVDTPLKPPKAA